MTNPMSITKRGSKKTPPAGSLSDEALTWRQQLLDQFAIEDSAGQLLLDTALRAFDRMREAQRVIAEQGAYPKDRFGAPKAHPALIVERDARSGMLAALKALRLDLEPLAPGPGRPPGK